MARHARKFLHPDLIHRHPRDVLNWASLVVGVVGFVGNFCSIYILSRPSVASRFSNLLNVLAYVDICYVTLDLVKVVTRMWSSLRPGEGVDTFYWTYFPHFFHPLPQVFQTAMVILTVIFRWDSSISGLLLPSMDRYIAVFHPYLVYMGQGCLNTLLRGPKAGGIATYLACVLLPSALYSLPHFLEHRLIGKVGGKMVVAMVREAFSQNQVA